MLPDTFHEACNSSHAPSLAQVRSRHREQAGPVAELAHREAAGLWQRIERVLTETREQRIAYLLFHCALTPHEIVQRCPSEFATVQEVLVLRDTIMKKLLSIM